MVGDVSPLFVFLLNYITSRVEGGSGGLQTAVFLSIVLNLLCSILFYRFVALSVPLFHYYLRELVCDYARNREESTASAMMC